MLDGKRRKMDVRDELGVRSQTKKGAKNLGVAVMWRWNPDALDRQPVPYLLPKLSDGRRPRHDSRIR
jgi:hypothetical protein